MVWWTRRRSAPNGPKRQRAQCKWPEDDVTEEAKLRGLATDEGPQGADGNPGADVFRSDPGRADHLAREFAVFLQPIDHVHQAEEVGRFDQVRVRTQGIGTIDICTLLRGSEDDNGQGI